MKKMQTQKNIFFIHSKNEQKGGWRAFILSSSLCYVCMVNYEHFSVNTPNVDLRYMV